MVREYFDKAEDMPRSWGYQSIAPSEAYREGYDRIRWGVTEVKATASPSPAQERESWDRWRPDGSGW